MVTIAEVEALQIGVLALGTQFFGGVAGDVHECLAGELQFFGVQSEGFTVLPETVIVVEKITGAPHEPKAVTTILWVPLDKA